MLRVSTTQMVDEAERSLHDACAFVDSERDADGAWRCSEMLSCAVEAARIITGKEAIVTKASSLPRWGRYR